MGKYKPMQDQQYADMYGIKMKDVYDDEGNLNDNEHDNRAMLAGHQANNYDMRRAHEMLQDDGFRRQMKQEGLKGIDRMLKDNLPSTAMITALADYGGKVGTHNNKGTFDIRDLGATSKALYGQHRDFLDNKYMGAGNNNAPETQERDTSNDFVEYSPELAAAKSYTSAYQDYREQGLDTDLKFGDSEQQQGARDAFKSYYASNLKENLKPNPESQRGKNLGMPAGLRFEGANYVKGRKFGT